MDDDESARKWLSYDACCAGALEGHQQRPVVAVRIGDLAGEDNQSARRPDDRVERTVFGSP